MTSQFEPYLSAEQIAQRVAELGKEISDFYHGTNITVVCILTGSVVFTCDLIRHITVPCTLQFVRASSYLGTESSGHVAIVPAQNQLKLRGENVLIIEDIMDTGRTLQRLHQRFLLEKPADLRICTLLDKTSRRDPQIQLQADFVGFTIPDRFIVGYGLDFNEKYRELPYIGFYSPKE